MCGIAGWVGLTNHEPHDLIRQMVAAIGHRGPDERGYFVEPPAALGMSRLSIIDIVGGSQPKTADDGRLQVVLNGEIYNYRHLMDELHGLGHRFESTSDTEVVARALQEWGPSAIARLDGMFAIAAWDRREETLLLARDRLGKKPLYVWQHQGSLAFGSELKALAPVRAWPELDVTALAAYLHLGYVAAPRSIWKGITKLPAAHVGTFKAGSDLVLTPFWALEPTPPTTEQDAVDQLEGRLRVAVADRLVADVEVGVLLSGGIDSSLVAWLAAEQHPHIRTFSIGFEDPHLDESSHAAEVAQTLGTTHHARVVTANDALSVVDELATVYDEPFADSSAIPTLLVSRFASEHVKVVLAGDGGDELFSGYPRYRAYERIRLLRRLVPTPAREAGRSWARHRGHLLSRVGNVLDVMERDDAATYRNVVAILKPQLLSEVLGFRPDLDEVTSSFAACFARFGDRGPEAADLFHYLQDDLLVKVDRASMSTGLEVRAPFLDHRLVSWSVGLPSSAIGPRGGKTVPRSLLARRFGPQIAYRPKQGFAVPLATWLKGPLRHLLDDVLSSDSLSAHGLIKPSGVALLRQRLDAGRQGAASPLWALLMFQLWHDHWVKNRAPSRD